MMRIRHWLLTSVLASCGTLALANPTPQEDSVNAEKKSLYPRVKMQTSLGDIVIELNAEKAPISTENFLQYVKDDFYDGTVFHRVMKTFMIQGGGFDENMDKKEKGLRGGIKNEWKNGLKNKRGSIAMARLGGQADSATAQFFINVVDNSSLDLARDGAAYAVFGKVVEGMEVVDKIRNTPVGPHPKYPQPAVPKEKVVIKDVEMVGEVDWDAIKKAANAARENASKSMKDQIEAEFGKKFQKTDSGLMYLVEKEGTGASPKVTDTIKFHYTGTLMDGTKFDSSYDRNEPLVYPLNQLIKGWQEGLTNMKVGGKRHFVIPGNLAYGPAGRPPVIPSNATLYFVVELLEIQ